MLCEHSSHYSDSQRLGILASFTAKSFSSFFSSLISQCSNPEIVRNPFVQVGNSGNVQKVCTVNFIQVKDVHHYHPYSTDQFYDLFSGLPAMNSLF